MTDKVLGHATAYGYYKAGGGTMTEAEFTEFMADFGTASQTAVEAAQAALASKNAAQTAATTATNKASEATTAATTATTKAAEAQADADAAALDASQAMSAASTATSKATEATTAAATAVSAKDDAVSANTAAQSAKTAAQTAQTGAETAAASVEASAEQIATNAEDISELKEDLSEVTEATRNLNTSNVGRWGNAADGKIYSRNDTFYGMESFIPITAGQTYYVSFGGITSSSAISWTYLFVNDSGTNLARAGYSNIDGHAITAPSGATKLHVFCRSDNTITISDDAYIQIEKGSSATQHIPAISATDYFVRETADKAFQVYNVIDSSTDLDVLPKNGAYRWNTSSIPQHSPVEKASRLVNLPSDANSGTGWIQVAISSDTVMYMRYKITTNWSEWVELASKTYVDDKFSAITISEDAEWEV